MKVKVRFFASLKEQLGQDSLEVNAAFSPATVAGLRAHLCAEYPGFAKAIAEVGRLRAAVDQNMADDETPVGEQAEVAFFPPVTGG
ncbi:molybdopterin converting factor subunit 1 [Limnobacter sp.]|uniref:molybdopterin converting factor subunit 1 n=1 Tax=Limnobacter sp. TaxID=2003368 RepID=UPI0025C533C9|nr:molybdopterin converting factor subunit 1 [Limnobacter sp.]